MIESWRTGPGQLAVLAGLASHLLACEPGTCDEDVRAQVIDERVTLQLGDQTIDAELADEPTERERGWMHRRCDREALLLVPDAQGELPLWGCGLTAPIDLHLLRDANVVDVIRDLTPCDPPCGSCPVVADGIVVDAILESPAGALSAEAGDAVGGLPRAARLPR